MLQEHVKTTQTDKTRFFFAKKDELVTDKHLFIEVPSRKKNISPRITVNRTKKG